jgi:hypothetical protein
VHDRHRRERRIAVAAQQEHGHPELRQLVGDVVHREQRAKRVRVADRLELPILLVKFRLRPWVEGEPLGEVRVLGHRELRHRVHALRQRDLDRASAHHHVLPRERQPARRRRVGDDQ